MKRITLFFLTGIFFLFGIFGISQAEEPYRSSQIRCYNDKFSPVPCQSAGEFSCQGSVCVVTKNLSDLGSSGGHTSSTPAGRKTEIHSPKRKAHAGKGSPHPEDSQNRDIKLQTSPLAPVSASEPAKPTVLSEPTSPAARPVQPIPSSTTTSPTVLPIQSNDTGNAPLREPVVSVLVNSGEELVFEPTAPINTTSLHHRSDSVVPDENIGSGSEDQYATSEKAPEKKFLHTFPAEPTPIRAHGHSRSNTSTSTVRIPSPAPSEDEKEDQTDSVLSIREKTKRIAQALLKDPTKLSPLNEQFTNDDIDPEEFPPPPSPLLVEELESDEENENFIVPPPPVDADLSSPKKLAENSAPPSPPPPPPPGWQPEKPAGTPQNKTVPLAAPVSNGGGAATSRNGPMPTDLLSALNNTNPLANLKKSKPAGEKPASLGSVKDQLNDKIKRQAFKLKPVPDDKKNDRSSANLENHPKDPTQQGGIVGAFTRAVAQHADKNTSEDTTELSPEDQEDAKAWQQDEENSQQEAQQRAQTLKVTPTSHNPRPAPAVLPKQKMDPVTAARIKNEKEAARQAAEARTLSRAGRQAHTGSINRLIQGSRLLKAKDTEDLQDALYQVKTAYAQEKHAYAAYRKLPNSTTKTFFIHKTAETQQAIHDAEDRRTRHNRRQASEDSDSETSDSEDNFDDDITTPLPPKPSKEPAHLQESDVSPYASSDEDEGNKDDIDDDDDIKVSPPLSSPENQLSPLTQPEDLTPTEVSTPESSGDEDYSFDDPSGDKTEDASVIISGPETGGHFDGSGKFQGAALSTVHETPTLPVEDQNPLPTEGLPPTGPQADETERPLAPNSDVEEPPVNAGETEEEPLIAPDTPTDNEDFPGIPPPLTGGEALEDNFSTDEDTLSLPESPEGTDLTDLPGANFAPPEPIAADPVIGADPTGHTVGVTGENTGAAPVAGMDSFTTETTPTIETTASESFNDVTATDSVVTENTPAASDISVPADVAIEIAAAQPAAA